MKKAVYGTLAIVLGIGLAMALFATFRSYEIVGSSMLPTLEEDETVIINKIAYNNNAPKVGDIIVFPAKINAANGEGRHLVKRVIAIENQTVLISDGNVCVDMDILKEDYVFSQNSSGDMAPIKLEKDKVFVLGDNRAISVDSRDKTVGQIDISEIEGKVVFRLWPLKKLGTVK
ncbi:MAG: signal peptidase I [Anaerovoracaceae bacterium]